MKFSSWKSALASPAGRAFLALLLVLAAGAIFNADGAFFKIGTHRDTLRQASVYGMLACGMTLVIVSGGIDLAVGSLLALAAVCAAKMAIHWNWPWWEVVPATWRLELLCGSARVG
jgi:ribose transport system permease protein